MGNKEGIKSIHISYDYEISEEKTNNGNEILANQKRFDCWGEEYHTPTTCLVKENLFPTGYIKLGLMKQFVKAYNVKGDCIQFICTTFLRLSYDKINVGDFDAAQIKKIICKSKLNVKAFEAP